MPMPALLRSLAAAAVLVTATAGGVALAQHAPVVAQDLLIEEQPIAGGTQVTVSDLVPARDGTLVPVAARRYSEAAHP
jgi:hypothetical protein